MAVKDLAIYLPVIIWATIVVCLAQVWQPTAAKAQQSAQAVELDRRRWPIIQLLALALFLYAKGLVRVSPLHMGPSIVSSIIVLIVVLGHYLRSTLIAQGILAGCSSLAALCTLVLLPALSIRASANLLWLIDADQMIARLATSRYASVAQASTASCSPPEGLSRLACFYLDQRRIEAIQFVQALTKPSDYLFVGLTRHDKIFVNDIMFYFAAGRRSATKWHQFDPGLQTSADVQSAMITELKIRNPPLVVLESEWDAESEPNGSAESSKITSLDEFVHDNYELKKSFDTIFILTKR